MTFNLTVDLNNLDGLMAYINTNIQQTIETKFAELGGFSKPKNDFMTPAEVRAEFKKSIPTLNKLVKEGVLKKHTFPKVRGVFYYRPEILQVLIANA